MTRKAFLACLLALLLAAGCLFASCGAEPPQDGSDTASSEETTAEESPAETTTEETSEDTTTEETTTEPSSEPEKPDEPEEIKYYLPAEGILYDASPGSNENGNRRFSFVYGEDMAEITVRYANGDVFRYEYRFDGGGRIVGMVWDVIINGDTNTETHTYTYDDAGHMTGSTVDRGENGVNTTAVYRYDTEGRLIHQSIQDVYGGVGFTQSDFTDYLRDYDENGRLTRLEERLSDGSYTEHLYEDGRETLCNYYGPDGDCQIVTAFDYDENGRLVQERSRNGRILYAITYSYDGDRLTESKRDEGDGARMRLRYRYDERGRVTEAQDAYHQNLLSYGENGNLCKLQVHNKLDGGEFILSETYEVTAWGDEAVTEVQLACYRVAMAKFFGNAGVGTEQFYTVAYPEP